MLNDVTQVLLPLQVGPEGEQLHFFCSLVGDEAVMDVFATVAVWNRLHRLTPEDQSVLMAAGVRGEDAWYALAGRWLQEARSELREPKQRQQLLESSTELQGLMRRTGPELFRFLNDHAMARTYAQRPQAARVH